MDADKMQREKSTSFFLTNPRNNTEQNNSYTTAYPLSQKPPKLDEQDMRETIWEVRKNS